MQILLFCFLIICIASIQLGYWKYTSGKFIINPYGASNAGEGLELLNPHLLEVLFSFRKGWFIYTPLMLFTLVGFKELYKNNKVLFGHQSRLSSAFWRLPEFLSLSTQW